uniref:Uncharacterized protein n=1 Tax=Anguilla anguilla TaxID=7936 RepID=A0A0E9R740_ANGAN
MCSVPSSQNWRRNLIRNKHNLFWPIGTCYFPCLPLLLTH